MQNYQTLKKTAVLDVQLYSVFVDASQPSPLVHHDQIGVRCDRISCQNKGGVLICIPSQMQPTNTTRFALNVCALLYVYQMQACCK